jgi:hypothetical protein
MIMARTIELTDEQIAFLREDLKYTKHHFRGGIKSWEGMPHEWVVAQRNETLTMVESIDRRFGTLARPWGKSGRVAG